MISKAEAVNLLNEWAGGELQEIRRIWYPATTPAFQEYQTGWRESSAIDSKKDLRRERVGAALFEMQPALRKVLISRFRSGRSHSRQLFEMSLLEFRRVYSASVADHISAGRTSDTESSRTALGNQAS